MWFGLLGEMKLYHECGTQKRVIIDEAKYVGHLVQGLGGGGGGGGRNSLPSVCVLQEVYFD